MIGGTLMFEKLKSWFCRQEKVEEPSLSSSRKLPLNSITPVEAAKVKAKKPRKKKNESI